MNYLNLLEMKKVNSNDTQKYDMMLLSEDEGNTRIESNDAYMFIF